MRPSTLGIPEKRRTSNAIIYQSHFLRLALVGNAHRFCTRHPRGVVFGQNGGAGTASDLAQSGVGTDFMGSPPLDEYLLDAREYQLRYRFRAIDLSAEDPGSIVRYRLPDMD